MQMVLRKKEIWSEWKLWQLLFICQITKKIKEESCQEILVCFRKWSLTVLIESMSQSYKKSVSNRSFYCRKSAGWWPGPCHSNHYCRGSAEWWPVPTHLQLRVKKFETDQSDVIWIIKTSICFCFPVIKTIADIPCDVSLSCFPKEI